MKFEDKYSTEDKEGKIKITTDAFAIGEMLEKLIIKLGMLIR